MSRSLAPAADPAPSRPIKRHDRIDARAATVMVLLCLCWGFQQAAVKLSIMGGIPPMTQAAWRSIIATVLLAAWIATGRDGGLAMLFRRDRSWWPGLAAAALFAAEFLLIFQGLAKTTAARGVVLLYTAPFFVALGAHLFLPTERLRVVQVAGLACAFAGVVLAVFDGLGGPVEMLYGDALMFVAAGLWGATTVLIKASPALMRIPASKVMFYQVAGSAVALSAVAIGQGEMMTIFDATPLGWASFAYQALIVATVGFLAWFELIARYPASQLSAFSFLTPLFGMGFGWLVLGEPVTVLLAGALVLVAIGIRLVNAPKKA